VGAWVWARDYVHRWLDIRAATNADFPPRYCFTQHFAIRRLNHAKGSKTTLCLERLIYQTNVLNICNSIRESPSYKTENMCGGRLRMNVFSAWFHLTKHRVVVTTNLASEPHSSPHKHSVQCTYTLQMRYAIYIPLSSVAIQNWYNIFRTPTECVLNWLYSPCWHGNARALSWIYMYLWQSTVYIHLKDYKCPWPSDGCLGYVHCIFHKVQHTMVYLPYLSLRTLDSGPRTYQTYMFYMYIHTHIRYMY